MHCGFLALRFSIGCRQSNQPNEYSSLPFCSACVCAVTYGHGHRRPLALDASIVTSLYGRVDSTCPALLGRLPVIRPVERKPTSACSAALRLTASVVFFPLGGLLALDLVQGKYYNTRLRLRHRTQLLSHPRRPHPLEVVPTLATTRRRIKYRTAMQPSSSVSPAAPFSLFKLTQTHAFLFRPEQEIQIEHSPLPDHWRLVQKR